MKKDYCTQNNGDCQTCSLVNYGMDCRNQPVTKPTAHRLPSFKPDKLIRKEKKHAN